MAYLYDGVTYLVDRFSEYVPKSIGGGGGEVKVLAETSFPDLGSYTESIATAMKWCSVRLSGAAHTIAQTTQFRAIAGPLVESSTMLFSKVAKLYTDIAYGESNGDRAIATSYGHLIVLLVTGLYLFASTGAKNTGSGVVRGVLKQQFVLIKVGFVEFCGCLYSIADSLD